MNAYIINGLFQLYNLCLRTRFKPCICVVPACIILSACLLFLPTSPPLLSAPSPSPFHLRMGPVNPVFTGQSFVFFSGKYLPSLLITKPRHAPTCPSFGKMCRRRSPSMLSPMSPMPCLGPPFPLLALCHLLLLHRPACALEKAFSPHQYPPSAPPNLSPSTFPLVLNTTLNQLLHFQHRSSRPASAQHKRICKVFSLTLLH